VRPAPAQQIDDWPSIDLLLNEPSPVELARRQEAERQRLLELGRQLRRRYGVSGTAPAQPVHPRHRETQRFESHDQRRREAWGVGRPGQPADVSEEDIRRWTERGRALARSLRREQA
jgi:hypothetical protein